MSLRDIADSVVPNRGEGDPESSADSRTDSEPGADDVRSHPGTVDVPDGVPMLQAEGIAVSLGGVEILTDVSMSADRGELVGLVGPNGAGKTTLIRILRATLTPDAGEVRIAGDPVTARSARAVSRLVASVPQTTALTFDFSVEETIEMGRTPHVSRFGGLDETDREIVRDAMARTAVSEFADRSITDVSGGERQRVLLARALAQDTPVLLLDEPTANLDINHAIRTLELVRALVDDGKTAVAAIHDLNLAARYCDELVLIADGQVHASGPPAEVLTQETLREAFDAETLVTNRTATGTPQVTALPDREAGTGHRVHVVGTGQETAVAVSRLVAAGHEVSLGVTPESDLAAETAEDLEVESVTVPPFRGLTDDAIRRASALAHDADVTAVVGPLDPDLEPIVAAGSTVVRVTDRSRRGDGTQDGIGQLEGVVDRRVESPQELPAVVSSLCSDV